MKPVLVLQHLSADGPAWLGTWLARRGLAMELRNAEAGEEFPQRLEGYAALAILGGEMSANDPLPSLRQAERLFMQALEQGVPTLGHCLGGQLMARALGARIVDSPAPEVGWHPVQVLDEPAARAWFGTPAEQMVFQWHYEAFELPAGATRLAGSAACPNQAFSVGPHLAMQFHLEIDREKLQRWSNETGERYRQGLHTHATVHAGDRMRAGAELHLADQQRLAERIYSRWIDAVPRG
jgi:GMP synthase-like glutamine amidotransferase